MKKIFTKIVTVYMIVAAIALVLKTGDNMLAKASTSNVADQCGINNGWVWNGTQCVNVCDQNHPWDSSQQKCSNGYGYYGNSGYGYVPGNSNYTGNCSAYGSNYFWNGSVCAEATIRSNASYTGNPYNGGYSTPVYNYNPVSNYNNNYNDNYSNYYYNNNNNYNDYGYVSYVPTNTCISCHVVNPAPKVITTYYVYTTVTTSYPSYSNYTYLGNNNNGYYNNYWDCDYSDYQNVGYYDIYGYYHF